MKRQVVLVNGQKIIVKKFNDKRVLTVKDVEISLGLKPRQVQNYMVRAKKYLVEGEDYFSATYADLWAMDCFSQAERSHFRGSPKNECYFITKSGVNSMYEKMKNFEKSENGLADLNKKYFVNRPVKRLMSIEGNLAKQDAEEENEQIELKLVEPEVEEEPVEEPKVESVEEDEKVTEISDEAKLDCSEFVASMVKENPWKEDSIMSKPQLESLNNELNNALNNYASVEKKVESEVISPMDYMMQLYNRQMDFLESERKSNEEFRNSMSESFAMLSQIIMNQSKVIEKMATKKIKDDTPKEQPTKTDYATWQENIRNIIGDRDFKTCMGKVYKRMNENFGVCWDQEKKDYAKETGHRAYSTFEIAYWMERNKPEYKNLTSSVLVSLIEEGEIE